MDNCIFCSIARNEFPHHKVWENEKYVAFLDARPLNPGHTLVVPRAHEGYVFDLPDQEYGDLFQTVKLLSLPLRQATGAKRIGIVVEGFGVDHVHVHLVPINAGHELDSHRATPADDAELAAMEAKIKHSIEELGLKRD